MEILNNFGVLIREMLTSGYWC